MPSVGSTGICDWCWTEWSKDSYGHFVDLKGRKSYKADPLWLIRLKCLGVAVINPLRWVIVATSIAAKLVVWIFRPLGACCCRDTYNKLRKTSPQNKISEKIQQLVGSVFFAIAFELCAVGGLFFPLAGRKWCGAIEEEWNRLEHAFVLAHCFEGRDINSRM